MKVERVTRISIAVADDLVTTVTTQADGNWKSRVEIRKECVFHVVSAAYVYDIFIVPPLRRQGIRISESVGERLGKHVAAGAAAT